MKYKVVPFIATLNQNKPTAEQAASQLDDTIKKYTAGGWRYVRLESITTWVAPDSGCFGFGGRAGYMTSKQVIVFEADE